MSGTETGTGTGTEPAARGGSNYVNSGLSFRRLLAILFREEWRMHTQLFGGWRFARSSRS